MKNFILFLICSLFIVGFVYADDNVSIYSFDGTSAAWTTNPGADVSTFDLTDQANALNVTFDVATAAVTKASAEVAFDAITVSDYDEFRLKIKIDTAPTVTKMRLKVFVKSGGANYEYSDIDLLSSWYGATTDYFTVVIPYSSIEFDVATIDGFGFSVETLYAVAAGASFSIDELYVTKENAVGAVAGIFEDTATGEWSIEELAADAEINILEIEDEYDFVYEGGSAKKVTVEHNVAGAGWGTYSTAIYKTAEGQLLDLSGASEIRFMINVLEGATEDTTLPFGFDLFDMPAGAASNERHRFPANFETIRPEVTDDDGWAQVVIPLDQLIMPGWGEKNNEKIDLDAINELHFDFFEVFAQADQALIDRSVVVFDKLIATADPTYVAPVDKNQLYAFDGTSADWTTTPGAGVGTFTLADVDSSVAEGNGALAVTFDVADAATAKASAEVAFAAPVDISGDDELVLKVRILTAPANVKTRLSIYVKDGETVYTYSDLDLLSSWYGATADYITVVVPFAAMGLDAASVDAFGFNVETLYDVASGAVFLLDDLYVDSYEGIAGSTDIFEDTDTGEWSVEELAADAEINILEIEDEYDFVYEGGSAKKVTVEHNVAGAGWGTYSTAIYKTAEGQLLDLSGASEIRFMINVLEGATEDTTLPFGFDLFDMPAGAASNERHRFPANFETIRPEVTDDDGWAQVVIPLDQLIMPGWGEKNNEKIDLDAINELHFDFFEVFAQADQALIDRTVVVFDDLKASATTDVQDPRGGAVIADGFNLNQNYPNPFNPVTNISFNIPENGLTNLKIYNVMGQLVNTVVDNRFKLRGQYRFTVDMSGNPSGLYFYVLEQGHNKITKKMTLMK